MAEETLTVLIVDDNPVNREVWSMYLATEGYEVEIRAVELTLLLEQRFARPRIHDVVPRLGDLRGHA